MDVTVVPVRERMEEQSQRMGADVLAWSRRRPLNQVAASSSSRARAMGSTLAYWLYASIPA